MNFPPWPTAVLRGATEREALELLDRLVQRLGPLPQADWVEPFGPEDPDGWEVHVAFPTWEERFRGVATWAEGESPAEQRAREAGRLVEEPLGEALVFLRRTVDGVAAPPDLLRRDHGDAVVRSEAQTVEAALSAAHPGCVLREYHPVVDRRSGRFGIEFALGDDLPASAFDALARCVGGALAGRFAPSGTWEASHGSLCLVAWFDAAPVDGLPPGGADGGAPEVLFPLIGGSLAAVELRVLPARDPWSTAAEVAAAAEAGLELAPAAPVWVAGRHVPTWWALGPVPPLPGGTNLAVPVPRAYEDAWPELEVRCWWVEGVAFVCGHDPVARVEPWPEAEDRELDPDAWRPVAAGIGARGVRGIRRDGRDGIRWRFGPEAWTAQGLARALARVATVATPPPQSVEPWGLVGFAPDGVWVERTLTIP